MSALAGIRSLPILLALRVRDFRLLWLSEAISVVGDQFHYVALAWLVIDLTQSGLALGTVLIAIGVPRAIMLLPFGVLADRRPPRTLMLVAHLGRGAVVGAITALVLTDAATLPLLALLGGGFGVFDALYIPAQQAFLPRTLEAERLPSANAVLQGTLQLASIAGPPIAGAAIAIVGTGAAFVVDTASFLVAALVVALISAQGAVVRPAPAPEAASEPATAEPVVATAEPIVAAVEPLVAAVEPVVAAVEPVVAAVEPVVAAVEPVETPEEGFLDAVRAGIRHVLDDPALRTTLAIALVLNFALNGPASVGIPWLAEIRFHAGPTGLGLLSAAWALGALAGTVIAGSYRAGRPGMTILGAVTIAGAGMVVVGLGAALLPVALALVAIGCAIGYVNIVAISWIQARVPSEMVGRVMSLTMLMSFGITPLSLGVSGWLIDLDATALFVASGVIVLGVVLAASLARYPAAFDAPAPAPAAA